jgi:hypothetical protein
MKKLLPFVITLLFPVILYCQNAEKCGGPVISMGVDLASSTTLTVGFKRPLRPKEFWHDKNKKEYENSFVIYYKPVFTLGDNSLMGKGIDTATKRYDLQLTADNDYANVDLKNLLPGTTYDVCVYTRCGQKLAGPLCSSKTTSTIAPCFIKLIRSNNSSADFTFEFYPKTSIHPTRILIEYGEGDTNWQLMEGQSLSGFSITGLKPGKTYLIRVQFEYPNKVLSMHSPVLAFHTGG